MTEITPYFNAITSERVYKTRFTAENAKGLSDLNLNAANRWGREELFACRVVRRSAQSLVLPILSQHLSQSREPFPPEIHRFLDGPTNEQMQWSEHDLVRECSVLGQVWAAMAMFKRHDPYDTDDIDDSDEDSISSTHRAVKRARRNTAQESVYVDSSMIQIGSSSPLAGDSQGTSSVGYVDQESQRLLALPEDDTLRLASCVIRYILYFAPPQHLMSEPVVVEFRDGRSRLSAYTPASKRKLTAIDDGGLRLLQRSRDILKPTKNAVAMLEAKREFQCIENGRPVTSDQCFAQMTCEALVARLADPFEEFEQESVIIINVIQHYMCFLDFKISQDYINDFESDTPTHFIHVESTPWLDVFSKSGREHIVSNVQGLMCRARVS